MHFQVKETCPRCHKPIGQATIEAYPSRPDFALHSFHCQTCGPVKTKIISIKAEPPQR